jgi:hypothetical protein
MPIAWAEDFSYGYYRRLLRAVRAHWQPLLLREAADALYEGGARVLFLRHDVDVSLERAVRVAAIESECGVRSAYMILNAAPCYSLRDGAARTAIRRLIQLGHEVGLHFDYPDEERRSQTDPARLEAEIDRAALELEEVAGAPVESLSFYPPVAFVIRGPLRVAGRINAYAASLMERYISDSKGSWREGEPLPAIESPDGPRILQVLTHPIWWGSEHRSRHDRLDEFVEESTRELDADTRRRFAADVAATLPGVSYGYNTPDRMRVTNP